MKGWLSGQLHTSLGYMAGCLDLHLPLLHKLGDLCARILYGSLKRGDNSIVMM